MIAGGLRMRPSRQQNRPTIGEILSHMKEFTRLFAYIWPQWPRVIVVVVSAMAIAMLLSVSFIMIIPILKVMLTDEGLHGWVDRTTCETAYGLRFHVPSSAELSEGTGPSLQTHLLVAHVQENGLAGKAGLKRDDYISDIVGTDIALPGENRSYPLLLQALAGTSQETIRLDIKRRAQQGFVPLTLELNTPANHAYVRTLDWNVFARVKWQATLGGLSIAHWAVSFLPREQSTHGRVSAITLIMTAMLIVTVVRCVAKFYQDYLAEKVVQIGINELREDVFVHMTRMPIGEFASERPSDLISRVVRDTNAMGSAIKMLLGKALREPLNAMFMLAMAMLLNWQLALIFLCGAPAVVFMLGKFGRRMRKATKRSLQSSAEMLGKLQETVAGLRVVKIYGQQEHERQRFHLINERLLKQLLRISRVDAATHPVLEVLGMIAGSVAIVAGMAWVTQGNVEGATFFAILGLLGGAAEAARKTSDIWNKLQQANAAAERVFGIMDEPVETEKPGAVALPPVSRSVEFREVVFTYPRAERPALNGINLTVAAGRNVAIVGANGSGKTTLVNLLPRFYDPDSGRILVDGQDIADVTLESLRGQIGMVTQQIISFNDTVRANIRYGRKDASEEEIVAAAKAAFAHEFIMQLPQGYDAVIGEQGTGLSGGQLQRIVIARAIIKNPAILIFDEATSQIDAESEAKIHAATQEIMRGRTTFIIAHRFSTVVAADVIVVMNDGRIIAQGRHEELIRTCPVYQALYETQLAR
jgi:ABC-type multidrug transport system fused ATPase/permease subunit